MAKVCTIRNLSTSFDITAIHLIQEWTNIFRKNRIPEPELSAKYLILHICSNSRVSYVTISTHECVTML